MTQPGIGAALAQHDPSTTRHHTCHPPSSLGKAATTPPLVSVLSSSPIC